MKRIKIVTKGEANRVLVDSLFKPVNGGTLNKERWDMGHYRADASFVGREVEVPDHVHAIWAEGRRDSDGSYKALFCLTSRQS